MGSRFGGPIVDILAKVKRATGVRSVGQNGLLVAEWGLVDTSGAELKLVMWNEIAESWSESVRVGDVVHLSSEFLFLLPNLGVSPKASRALTPNDNSFEDITVQVKQDQRKDSILQGTPHANKNPDFQICWRTVQRNPGDAAFNFHRRYGDLTNKARAVLELENVN